LLNGDLGHRHGLDRPVVGNGSNRGYGTYHVYALDRLPECGVVIIQKRLRTVADEEL